MQLAARRNHFFASLQLRNFEKKIDRSQGKRRRTTTQQYQLLFRWSHRLKSRRRQRPLRPARCSPTFAACSASAFQRYLCAMHELGLVRAHKTNSTPHTHKPQQKRAAFESAHQLEKKPLKLSEEQRCLALARVHTRPAPRIENRCAQRAAANAHTANAGGGTRGAARTNAVGGARPLDF